MHATKITPRVYAACLASYNAGRLYGRWIDCDKGADHIVSELSDMLRKSPEPGAEEWAFHDSEYMGLVGECDDVERLAAIGEAVAEAGDDYPALLAWLDGDRTREPGDFADCFMGRWDSAADYVADYYDSAYTEKELGPLASYIDWGAVARDWGYNGDIETAPADGGGVYVFRPE